MNHRSCQLCFRILVFSFLVLSATDAYVIPIRRHQEPTVARGPGTFLSSNVNDESVTRLPTSSGGERKNFSNKRGDKKQRKKFNKYNPQQSKKSSRIDVWKRLNRSLVDCQNAGELLMLLQSTPNALTRKAGGGALNMVNFSTAIHRLARHSLQPNARAPLLKDARFALLVAALSEAMVPFYSSKTDELQRVKFKSRELSNMAWGLAKLRVVPPASALPLQASEEETIKAMEETATEIRKLVVQSIKERQNNGESAGSTNTPWVPLVSKLTGLIHDFIRFEVPRTFGTVSMDEDSSSSKVVSLNAFQPQEVANLLWAWATAGRGEETVFGNLISLLMENQKQAIAENNVDLIPQEWSNSIWATATAGIYCNHDELFEFVATAMERDADFLARFKSQEISNTLWGVATLLSKKEGGLTVREETAALKIERVLVQALVDRSLSDFKTQEVTNTFWSLATLGFGLQQSEEQDMNNYVVLHSDDLESDQILLKRIIDTVVNRALDIITFAKPQEINNIAWSLARLVELDDKTPDIDELLWAIGQELGNPGKPMTSQDIGTTLWSFATLGIVDPELYRNGVGRLVQLDGSQCKPQELSNSLWAIATAEIELYKDRDAFDTTMLHGRERPPISDPIVKSFGIGAIELMRRPEEFKTQEIKDILWSFSKVGIRHPQLFKSIAEHLVGEQENSPSARGLADFSPQGIGNLAWAFARQAQMCEEAGLRLKGSTALANVNGRLAVYTTSYFDIGENLLQRLFLSIADTGIHVHKRLSILKPQDLSNTAWTFAILGLRHEGFVEAAVEQLRTRIGAFLDGQVNNWSRFKGQELANLLWALATLNAPVGDCIEQHVSVYLDKILSVDGTPIRADIISRHFIRQELSNIAWSCAVFGSFSKPLMLNLYTGLLGSGTDRDGERMKQIYGDGGLRTQEVMTLMYVQVALAQAGYAGGDVSLPEDFPGQWQYEYDSREQLPGSVNDDPFDLTLTTSLLQKSVSDAFKRIGFNHCVEHVISVNDLAQQYDLFLSKRDSEVLSIDIADVDARIAVEVDGPAHYVCQIDKGLEVNGYTILSSKGKLEYQFRWNGDIQRANGATALKRRLLEGLGWKVISLPFWDWASVDGDAEAEEKYCRNLLESSS